MPTATKPKTPIDDPLAGVKNDVPPTPGDQDAPTAAPRLTADQLTPDSLNGIRIWSFNEVIRLIDSQALLVGVTSYLEGIGPFEFTKGELYLRSLYTVLNRECGRARQDEDFNTARKMSVLIVLVRRIFDSGFAIDDLAFACSSIKGLTLPGGERFLKDTAWTQYRAHIDQVRAMEAEQGLDSPEVLLACYDDDHSAGLIQRQWLEAHS